MNIDPIDNPQNHAAHSGHKGGYCPGEGKNLSYIDAKGKVSPLVIGYRAHVNSLGGKFKKKPEKYQKEDAYSKSCHINRRDADHSPINTHRFRKKIRVCVESPAPDEQNQTFEHCRQSNRQHDDKD